MTEFINVSVEIEVPAVRDLRALTIDPAGVVQEELKIYERFHVQGMLRLIEQRLYEVARGRSKNARSTFNDLLQEYRRFLLFDAAAVESIPVLLKD